MRRASTDRQPLAGVPDPELVPAIVTLTVLVGLFQWLLGALKLGSLTRFISNAVMTGFFTGIAVIIILSQLGHLAGYDIEAARPAGQAVDLLLNLGQADLPSLAIELATIVSIFALARTRLRVFSLIIALLAASAAVLAFDMASVHLVGDSYEISGAFPSLALPKLSLVPGLLLPAVSIGLIGLIQSAGVSQSIPNPDGTYPDASRDFTGQGIGNTAAGLFQGLPVGGTLAGTAVTMSAGARSRWANVFAALGDTWLRVTSNPKVAGSNLGGGASKSLVWRRSLARVSRSECHVDASRPY